MPQPTVYIMASARNGTVYVGVTSDLIKRVYEHRTAAAPGFTARYGCKLLVYFELWQDVTGAITREKTAQSGVAGAQAGTHRG